MFHEKAEQPDPTPVPNPPPAAEHVWDWFWELSQQRRSGPEAITWADVWAWAELTGTEIRPREARMLMAMDAAYRGAVQQEHEDQRNAAKSQAPAKKPRSRR